MVSFFACSSSKEESRWHTAKEKINYFLFMDSGIEADTNCFNVIYDSIIPNKYAFDLDYEWKFRIQFEASCFPGLRELIHSSCFFNAVDPYKNGGPGSWSTIDPHKIEGVWRLDSSDHMYRFYQLPGQTNPIYINIDTTTHILEYSYTHI
jgi:hypothetical protein